MVFSLALGWAYFCAGLLEYPIVVDRLKKFSEIMAPKCSFHYHVHERSPLNCIISLLNGIYKPTSYFFKI
jgi:hypothetical protein